MEGRLFVSHIPSAQQLGPYASCVVVALLFITGDLSFLSTPLLLKAVFDTPSWF